MTRPSWFPKLLPETNVLSPQPEIETDRWSKPDVMTTGGIDYSFL
jgi:hypothetical protein